MTTPTGQPNFDDAALAKLVDYAYGPAAARGRQAQARELRELSVGAAKWLLKLAHRSSAIQACGAPHGLASKCRT